MIEAVFDASVPIAIFRDEPFDGRIPDLIESAVMSAVNVAEVWTKVHEYGLTHAPRVEAFFDLLLRIEPFTASQARLTADLRRSTRHVGLSLGDRACLALAIEMGAEVYTAERRWSQVEVGCKVHLIR